MAFFLGCDVGKTKLDVVMSPTTGWLLPSCHTLLSGRPSTSPRQRRCTLPKPQNPALSGHIRTGIANYEYHHNQDNRNNLVGDPSGLIPSSNRYMGFSSSMVYE